MLTSVQNFPLEEHDAADGAVPQREMGVVISGYFIVSSFFRPSLPVQMPSGKLQADTIERGSSYFLYLYY